MLISWPPIVAVALAGGLLGGPPCWAKRPVVAKRMAAQTTRGFMCNSPLQRPEKWVAAATGTIVAPRGAGGEGIACSRPLDRDRRGAEVQRRWRKKSRCRWRVQSTLTRREWRRRQGSARF